MSKYNQLVMADRPLFFLASPTLTDRSTTSSVSISANNLSPEGQPIIYGNPSSFLMSETNNLAMSSDPVFVIGRTTEFVFFADKPEQETPIFSTDISSGIFIDSDYILVRMTVLEGQLLSTKTVQFRIFDWDQKFYTSIYIGQNQVVVTVNGVSSTVAFDGTIMLGTESNLTPDLVAGYQLLLDGFAIYEDLVSNKNGAVNDPGTGHDTYSSILYSGHTTRFNTYQTEGKFDVPFSSFTLENSGTAGETLSYTYISPLSNYDTKYLVVKTNDDSTVVEYSLDTAIYDSFIERTALPITGQGTVAFRIPTSTVVSFNMSIEIVIDGSISLQTSADLVATGTPIFPGRFEDSIVNYPEGVDMSLASYAGTWINLDVAVPSPPKTIEMVIRPIDSTEDVVIFKSSDGTVATDVQTGYDLWLNGEAVADLADLKWNQWNHLVIVKSSVSDFDFTLNTDGTSDPMNIRYAFMTSYEDELVEDDIVGLYSIVSGLDILSIDEEEVPFSEGVFDSGDGFGIYNLTWSIVGAGGN